MAGGRFAKQASYKGGGSIYWNSNNAYDTQIGGALSVAPAGSNIGSQAWQNFPGDRVILSPMDAVAFQNNNVGNMYTGTYRYVNVANSVSAPTRGYPGFWVPASGNNNQAVQDALYQVTSDGNNAAPFVGLFAGVFLNNPGKLGYWWIQESGKASCQFGTLTGTGTAGSGVYVGAPSNNNLIAFDQLIGANSAAIFTANSTTGYTTVDNMLVRYVGVAETAPSNNNVSPVDLIFRNGGFRW